MKNRVPFFPHDTNTSVEPEVVALIKNYGIEGYGLYFIIMELLGRSETFRLRIKTELEIECISAACGLQSEKFSSIVAYMRRLDLIQVDDGELSCRRFEKSIEPLLENREKTKERAARLRAEREKERAERKAEKDEVCQKDDKFDKKDESLSKSEGICQKDVHSIVECSIVEYSNFLGNGGKQAHEQKNQPTTDQKKNEIYEYEQVEEFLGANSDENTKKEKSSAKKEKDAGQDELGDGKNEKKGKIKGTEKGQAEKGKINPILKEIENDVCLISDFSHSFAPHWERWVKHLETKKFVLSSEMQEFQQKEFLSRANEQGIGIGDLEKLLILEIAATIQNEAKTGKNLTILNPFFHIKKIENEKSNSSKRKYKSIYSNR